MFIASEYCFHLEYDLIVFALRNLPGCHNNTKRKQQIQTWTSPLIEFYHFPPSIFTACSKLFPSLHFNIKLIFFYSHTNRAQKYFVDTAVTLRSQSVRHSNKKKHLEAELFLYVFSSTEALSRRNRKGFDWHNTVDAALRFLSLSEEIVEEKAIFLNSSNPQLWTLI